VLFSESNDGHAHDLDPYLIGLRSRSPELVAAQQPEPRAEAPAARPVSRLRDAARARGPPPLRDPDPFDRKAT
jgi:hypothetical protein